MPEPDRTAARTEDVLTALRRIMRAISLHSRLLVQRYGLTGPQLVVLKALSDFQDKSVGQLARQVNLSHATVTGILDRLEKRSLVQRRRGETDRRKVLVRATEACEPIFADAPSLLQDQFRQAFSNLADWEQTQILSSLQRVVAMMEAEHLDARPMLALGPLDAEADALPPDQASVEPEQDL